MKIKITEAQLLQYLNLTSRQLYKFHKQDWTWEKFGIIANNLKLINYRLICYEKNDEGNKIYTLDEF